MSRLATARRSSQAGWLGVSSSTVGPERRALPGAIGRPEDGEGRRTAVVRMDVSGVQRDGRARPGAAVDVAAVDHAAMMKAHLPLPERDDALERLVLFADEPPLERLQILRIERPHGLRVGPSVAAVDIDDWSHLDGTIVQRDPCGEHIL